MLKLQFKENPARNLWLAADKVTLGSDADNDIMLDGLGIDAFHASLVIDDGKVMLSSVAGSCHVNDLPVDDEHRLHPEDELRIGQHRILILTPQRADELRAAVHSDNKAARETVNTEWSLQAGHSKLKDKHYPITEKSILGRSRDCDLAVPYKLLSRHHVELTVRGGQLYLQDLGSANGSFVNGKRVTQARLQAGDELVFAKLAFTVCGPEPEEMLNKTMIRPAVDIESELKKRKKNKAADNPGSSLDVTPEADREVTETGRQGRPFAMLSVSILLVAGAASYWFLAR